MPKPFKVSTSFTSDEIDQVSTLSQSMEDGNEKSASNFLEDKETNGIEEGTDETLKFALSAESSGVMSLVEKRSNYRDYSQSNPDVSQLMVSSTKELTFPMKLHKVLSDSHFLLIITWLPHGRSWKIIDEKEFKDKVIPLYFNNCQYSSFVRQVSGWGFKRITKGADMNSYYHELFLRGLPHLCQRMRRLVSSGPRKPPSKDREEEPDFYKISEENPLPMSTSSHSPLEDNLVCPLATSVGTQADNLDTRCIIDPNNRYLSQIWSQNISRRTNGHGMDGANFRDKSLVHLEHPGIAQFCRVGSLQRNIATSSQLQKFSDSTEGPLQHNNTRNATHNNLQLNLLQMHNVSYASQSINGSDSDLQKVTDTNTSAATFSSSNLIGPTSHNQIRENILFSAHLNDSLKQLRHLREASYNAHTLYHQYNADPCVNTESVLPQIPHASILNARNLLDHSYFGATAFSSMSNKMISRQNSSQEKHALESLSEQTDNESKICTSTKEEAHNKPLHQS